jgi:hypothetical protein
MSEYLFQARASGANSLSHSEKAATAISSQRSRSTGSKILQTNISSSAALA